MARNDRPGPPPAEATPGGLTRQVAGVALAPVAAEPERPALLVSLGLAGLLVVSVAVLLARGIGAWGLDQAHPWGIDITTYLWWIGLGNAGAIISALLLLMGRGWRTALNRVAETMTLASAAVAGLFPILHLGRPWKVHWVFPVRVEDLDLWPQFRSPLTWDAYGIVTYLGVIGLFWYVGLIPDLASLRDRATRPGWARFHGILALGWRGSARHWAQWHAAYRLLAAITLPFVVLVHAGAALLLAGGPIPGWHSTIFPTLFMVGGTLAGLAVTGVLAVLLRAGLGMGNIITRDHLDRLCRLTLVSALLYLHLHLVEIWTVLYRHDMAEVAVLRDRLLGALAPLLWAGWMGSIGAAQLFWRRAVRRSPAAVAVIGTVIGVAIFLVHYVLLVGPLGHGHFPAMWRTYVPTLWDHGVLAGSVGLFAALLLIALRIVPPVALAELKEVAAHRAAPS